MDRAELRERTWRIIEREWDRSRPPGGVGTTESKTVYDHLLAEGVDVSPEAMNEILEEMYDEGLIRGPRYLDREGRRLHGARDIIEPEWRLYEPGAPQ